MAAAVTRESYAQALIAEFVSAVEAVLGAASASPMAERAAGDGWLVTAAASGDLRGTVSAWIDRAGIDVLAQRVLGIEDKPDPATIADMLREMWSQAAGALSMKEPFTGVKLVMQSVDGQAAPDGCAAMLIAGDIIAQLAVGGDAAPAPMPTAAQPTVHVPELVANDTLDAVLDMELPLVVRFARTIMPLKALAGLGPGSIVDMERSPDEPVLMLVGDRVIARGEVVVVGGHYGVRVTDLVSSSERARAVEGRQ
jgi:flagellar motor switch protein FliN/FliY